MVILHNAICKLIKIAGKVKKKCPLEGNCPYSPVQFPHSPRHAVYWKGAAFLPGAVPISGQDVVPPMWSAASAVPGKGMWTRPATARGFLWSWQRLWWYWQRYCGYSSGNGATRTDFFCCYVGSITVQCGSSFFCLSPSPPWYLSHQHRIKPRIPPTFILVGSICCFCNCRSLPLLCNYR